MGDGSLEFRCLCGWTSTTAPNEAWTCDAAFHHDIAPLFAEDAPGESVLVELDELFAGIS